MRTKSLTASLLLLTFSAGAATITNVNTGAYLDDPDADVGFDAFRKLNTNDMFLNLWVSQRQETNENLSGWSLLGTNLFPLKSTLGTLAWTNVETARVHMGTNAILLESTGQGLADTNWVLQQVATLATHVYGTTTTNTGALAGRTNNWKGWATVQGTAATNTITGLQAGTYVYQIVSTNTLVRLGDGPVSMELYAFKGAAGTLTLHPEFYLYDTVADTLAEIAAPAAKTIAAGSPAEYIWAPLVSSTNLANPCKIVMSVKIDTAVGNPELNLVFGGAYDSQLTYVQNIANATIQASQIVGLTNQWPVAAITNAGTAAYSNSAAFQGALGFTPQIASGNLTNWSAIPAPNPWLSGGFFEDFETHARAKIVALLGTSHTAGHYTGGGPPYTNAVGVTAISTASTTSGNTILSTDTTAGSEQVFIPGNGIAMTNEWRIYTASMPALSSNPHGIQIGFGTRFSDSGFSTNGVYFRGWTNNANRYWEFICASNSVYTTNVISSVWTNTPTWIKLRVEITANTNAIGRLWDGSAWTSTTNTSNVPVGKELGAAFKVQKYAGNTPVTWCVDYCWLAFTLGSER